MESYLTWLTVFIGLTTLALAVQAVMLVIAYLRLAKLEQESRALYRQLSEQAAPILRNVEDITLTVRDKGRLIADDLTAMSYDARRQMEKLDQLTDELADRLRLQLIRADQLLSQAIDNLEQAGATVKSNIVAPVREAAAVVAGVKAAVEFLGARSRRRGRGKGAREGEELFI